MTERIDIVVGAGFDLRGATTLALNVLRPDGTQFVVQLPDPNLRIGPSTISLNLGTFEANEYVLYRLQPGDVTIPGPYSCKLKYLGPLKGRVIENSTFVVDA